MNSIAIIFARFYRWGDKFEDKVRRWCSHRPILYAFVGGFGVVVFWRGAWHSMDLAMEYFFSPLGRVQPSSFPWWDGPVSLLLGSVIMLSAGLFVSNFIGNEIIISGLRGQKKLVEKTESEVLSEVETIEEIHTDVHAMVRQIGDIERNIIKK